MGFEAEAKTYMLALLTAGAGAGRTIPIGRFVEHAPDGDSEQQPVDSAERKVRVLIFKDNANSRPYNAADGFAINSYNVTIRITYTITNAGGDAIESSAEQGGPGTLDAIDSRKEADRGEIQRVLDYVENTYGHALTSGTIVGVFEDGNRSPSGAPRGLLYVYELFYRMVANVTSGAAEITS